ncbi:unnamed protein product [Vitrella brassicaformis CCMP3155]|uniref:Uncharacterized protein n=1 Tax=Vitrella brassicaformis (strain CCMP3155) TaxID=1169540 RepID=A0A0G4F6L1_VITBC|nr:unnamed protein product [Vitrella brassicaformis CCMP3155]|mmetsp:Transcript_29592/g.85678  ORF Transcript_29592/g.85678 Transcript_29592/m.85678 type:complete len:161 (+) Transcript_29592:103-585(+)|eukprot:CEM08055.1 unnamed protein product [Vitrella brassicaformis CCMP3155]
MVKLVVPSDITVAEEKTSLGVRKLTRMEHLGLLLYPPTLHFNYTKPDKSDMYKVLTKRFSQDKVRPYIAEICATRQESISKQVQCMVYLWLGTAVTTVGTWYSLRHYDWKAKLITLPFMAYGGSWLGRWTGDLITCRWWEYGRDRWLASLPGKTVYSPAQ